jgi:hypothetical protein
MNEFHSNISREAVEGEAIGMSRSSGLQKDAEKVGVSSKRTFEQLMAAPPPCFPLCDDITVLERESVDLDVIYTIIVPPTRLFHFGSDDVRPSSATTKMPTTTKRCDPASIDFYLVSLPCVRVPRQECPQPAPIL